MKTATALRKGDKGNEVQRLFEMVGLKDLRLLHAGLNPFSCDRAQAVIANRKKRRSTERLFSAYAYQRKRLGEPSMTRLRQL